MRKLTLAAVAAFLLATGSGCKIFCRGCNSSAYPSDLPVATREPDRVG